MMETRAHFVAVGAFVLLLTFLAFGAVLWLAGTQFATEYTHYDIFFNSVTGLSKGARVDYNGVPVGQVSDIQLDPQNPEQIRVTVDLEKTVVIKENVRAEIQTNILSGVSTILLTRGTQEAAVLAAHPGERYPVIKARRSAFASITARGPQLVEKIDEILDSLQEVLNDHNRKAFAETLDNVRTLSSDLDQRSKDLGEALVSTEHAMASVSKLLNDVDQSYTQPDGLKDELSAALVDFDRLVKGLGTTNRDIQQTLQDVRPGLRNFSTHTLTDVDNLVGEARQFVSGLSRLSTAFERDPARLLFGDRREGYRPQ
jgi:phospholipid/cholesterol/gamma-HCH transport system substrate-binding protein